MDNTFSRHRAGLAPAQITPSPQEAGPPVDLWGVLAELGAKLIQQHGFSRAELQGCSTHLNRTTEPLVRFLVWLQHTPEAGTVLRDMGVWQDTGECAEDVLNSRQQLPPALKRGAWPHHRNNSVA